MAKRSIPPQRGFFPQPSYLIGTYKEEDKPNFALITWVTFCSVEPPMLMFASRGKKITREQVEKNRMFSVNLVTTEMIDIADYFGTQSGFSINKCDAINVTCSKGEVVNAPVLDMSPWVYECMLVDMIQVGSGAIYIGEVKNIVVDEKITDTAYGKIDMINVDPLIYSPGGYYNLGRRVGNVGESKCRLKK
ncbi:MAG TPA: flavin reductase family protein [Clostridia bacterium]|nr:flavin reductase family protein [Clostridia bacterium]